MSWEDMCIKVDEGLEELMEERGIRLDDVKKAIALSEEAGDYLYDDQENRRLAKQRFGEFTVYAVYEKDAETYILSSAYGHRVQIESEA